jgi:cytochrome c oxidase cbb3-type subunit 1
MSYTVVSLQGSLTAIRAVNRVTHFTHYTVAHAHLGMYAFATMIMFGAIYYMLPRVLDREWPSAGLIELHFWACAGGISMYWVVLSVGGIVQGLALQNPDVPFLEVVALTIPYLHLRTISGILLFVGHMAFLISLGLMLLGWTRRAGVPTLLDDPNFGKTVNPA